MPGPPDSYTSGFPIRLIHDRWISKYAEPVVGRMAGVKAALEAGGQRHMAGPVHIYQIYIGAPQQAVWDALTDGDQTVQYFYGTRVESDWAEGSTLRYLDGEGRVVADGKVLSIDPPHRMEITFVAYWDPELTAEGPAREVWQVDPAGEASSKLTMELYDVADGDKRYTDFMSGSPVILSGLKTLLETGQPLTLA